MDGKETKDWIREGRAANHMANAENKELMRLKKRVPVVSKWVDSKG
jgi:hypothetical protein